jgi:hypothetical protein
MNEFHRIIVLVDQYLGKGIGLNEWYKYIRS